MKKPACTESHPNIKVMSEIPYLFELLKSLIKNSPTLEITFLFCGKG